MKALFIVLTLCFMSFNTQASLKKAERLYNKDRSKYLEQIIEELMKSKYFFSASLMAKDYLIEKDKISKRFEKRLETLILKTGTQSFLPLSNNVLEKHDSKALSLVLGIKYFKRNKFRKAIKVLDRIPKKHRFSPEAWMIKASSYSLLKKEKESLKSYKGCYELAGNFESRSKNSKLKRYFEILKETCHIHVARVYYTRKDYKKALNLYDRIPKHSYKWPYLLLEKAWSHYYLKDYNRTLGILTTYKSPLLSSYFMPENEVLNALSYFRMCLWNDTLKVIEQYYKVYKSRSDQLKKILVKHKKSHTFFLKLLFTDVSKTEKANPFIRNLVTQVKKQIKFSVDVVNYKKAQNELKFVRKMKKSGFRKLLIKDLKTEISWRAKHLNHLLKVAMFDFLNDIHRFSFEMFNIKLEIYAQQRNLVYKNKRLVSYRNRGSDENIERADHQQFYNFRGEFWADELGEYSFGLKSNCKVVSKKKLRAEK
jgi:tetratricopeptide (TPR) repeat protein